VPWSACIANRLVLGKKDTGTSDGPLALRPSQGLSGSGSICKNKARALDAAFADARKAVVVDQYGASA
jgi:hypothetical protein